MPFGSPYPYYQGLVQAPLQDAFSWEDLYRPQPTLQYPEAPDLDVGFSDLSEEQRQALRRQRWLAIAQALGEASHTGRLGDSLSRNVAGLEGERQQMIEQERQHRQALYQQQIQEAERGYREQQTQLADTAAQEQAKALQGVYQKIVASDPALAGRAEAAARLGDMESLGRLFEVEVPKRAYLRSQGVDPDNPVAEEVLEQRLKQEEAERKAIAEREQLEEELRLRRASSILEYQQRLHDGTLFAPQAPPAPAGEKDPWRPSLEYDEQGNAVYVYPPRDPSQPIQRVPVPGIKSYGSLRTGDYLGTPILIDPRTGKSFEVQKPVPMPPPPTPPAPPRGQGRTIPIPVERKGEAPTRGQAGQKKDVRQIDADYQRVEAAVGALSSVPAEPGQPSPAAQARKLLATMSAAEVIAGIRRARRAGG